jgi:multiple sugar transport system substrate-binding protein
MARDISRRSLLLGAAGIAGAGLLAACAPGGTATTTGSTGTIKFWDTVWGPPEYITTGTTLVKGYKSPSGSFGAAYQSVDWGSWYQTFSSAIASGTGPAVSSGASTQPYQFYDQGQIAPSDDLYARYKKDGTLDDFQPGVFDILRYKGVLVSMPWAYDMTCYWYRPSLFEAAGADVPTNWDELRAAGLKLKANGVSGFGVAPTAGSFNYKHFTSLLLSNDAPLIDSEGNVNCLSDEFIEGTEFCLSLAKDGIIRPEMVSWTMDNLYSEIGRGSVGLASLSAGAFAYVDESIHSDFEIIPPLTGPSGSNACAGSVQSIMMYTNTPDQAESENFVDWYLTATQAYWEQKVTLVVPLRKSITAAIEETSPQIYRAGSLYGPTATSPLGSEFNSATVRYDASPALTDWAQRIAQGAGTARELCEPLQVALEQIKADS